jgi:hypothetical protein
VSKISGVKDTSILTEGTPVLVYVPSKDARQGVIMCALPTVLQGKVDGTQFGPVAFAVDHEGAAAMWSEDAYNEPVFDAGSRSNLVANAGRPSDVLPGDWMKINDHGTRVAVLGMMARMSAGGASVDVFALDDLLRVQSNQYQHYNALGEIQIYNDGGNITFEMAGSYRQPEVAGEDELGTELFQVESESDETHKQARVTMTEALRTLKRRFQIFLGSLGGGFQMFLAKPDPGTETYDRESKHKGMLQAHVSGSGRTILRSAGGLAFMRSDRIPIPKKMKEPYDPSGDKPEDGSLLMPKEPFTFSDEHPYARNLELRDATAWYVGQAYQRFTEHENDWHVPEESEEEIAPDDDYDVAGEESEDFSNPRHQGKMAGIFVEMDGSIVLRDAWGGEIYMRGGNIVISCPGDVMTMPGSSAITMAGHDVIQKAKKSVDVSATDNDVRIKAGNSLHAYTEDGGILLETASESATDHRFTDDRPGEASISAGIQLKAPESRIFQWAETVHLSGERVVAVETVDRERGQIYLLTGTVEAIGRAVQLTAAPLDGPETPEAGSLSSLLLTPSSASLASRGTTMIAATQSLLLVEDLQAAAIIWAGIDENPGEAIMDDAETIADTLFRDAEWQGTYKPDVGSDEISRSSIKFTHRTVEQYGTERATEVDTPGGASAFKLYQTPWQVLSERGFSLYSGLSTEEWEEQAVNDTYPWPGRQNQLGSTWITMEEETNVDAEGRSVDRNELQGSGSALTPKPLNEYLVTRR